MGIQDSYDYANQLNEQAEHVGGRGKGIAIDAIAGVGLAHWWGNHKRKKLGLAPQPMSNKLAVPMAFGLGWLLWWVPVGLMVVIAAAFHNLLIGALITAAIMYLGWKMWKNYRIKKYAQYYKEQAPKVWANVGKEPNLHAPGSDEWLSTAGERMRKNVGL